jgi:hypothetical protein
MPPGALLKRWAVAQPYLLAVGCLYTARGLALDVEGPDCGELGHSTVGSLLAAWARKAETSV